MKKYDITIEKHTYELNKSEQEWTLALRKSDVQVNEKQDLALLQIAHPLLMDTRVDWEEDAITFTYQLPKEHLSFAELKTATKEDKLRAMANMAAVEQLLDLPLTFLFIRKISYLTTIYYQQLPIEAYKEKCRQR